MAWAKVDDGWWSHPKVLGLSLPARGLWITTLSWSCAQRRSIVPEGLVSMVGGSNIEAKELVDAGLWLVGDGGWTIHQWAEYQDASLREKRAEAGRKGGIRSGESRRNEANTRSKDEANVEAGSLPIPSLPEEISQPRRASAAPADMPVTDEMRQWATKEGIRHDALETETAGFLDWHRSKGSKHKDWVAAWRTWMRKAKGFRPEITTAATLDDLGPNETYR